MNAEASGRELIERASCSRRSGAFPPPAWSQVGSGQTPDGWPPLADRVRALQVLRTLELLAAGHLTPGIAGIVTDRLHATLA